jgi:hypothetical protein
MALENPVEVALIRESGQICDLSQGIFWIFQQLNGFFDPQFPDVLPER